MKGARLEEPCAERGGEFTRSADFAPSPSSESWLQLSLWFCSFLWGDKLSFQPKGKNGRMRLLCLKIGVLSFVSPFPLPKWNLCSHSCFLGGTETETHCSFCQEVKISHGNISRQPDRICVHHLLVLTRAPCRARVGPRRCPPGPEGALPAALRRVPISFTWQIAAPRRARPHSTALAGSLAANGLQRGHSLERSCCNC